MDGWGMDDGWPWTMAVAGRVTATLPSQMKTNLFVVSGGDRHPGHWPWPTAGAPGHGQWP